MSTYETIITGGIKNMMIVNQEKCIGCSKCISECFPNCISITDKKATINNDTCFKCGHCIAVCPTNAIYSDEYNMEDVKEYDASSFDIPAENLLNFIKFRRSVRQFKNIDVENEKLQKIIEAGRFTQTAINMQDVSYTVIKENLPTIKTMTYDTLKALGEKMLEDPSQSIVFKRYAQMWINMHKAYNENPQKNDKLFFNAPSIIVVSASNELNAGLASSNMELMTNALGLGTFFSGFFVRAAKANPEIKNFIEIPEGKDVISCLVVGYPNVKFQRTVPRKSAEITWK